MEFEERATCWGCGRDYLRVAAEKWLCLDMLCEGSAARLKDDDSMGDISAHTATMITAVAESWRI